MDWRSHDQLDSTSDEAKRLLRSGVLRKTTIVTAREQTAGRGTHGRAWASPRDAGLYMSLIHLPQEEQPLPVRALLTLAAGVACAQTLQARYGLDVRLKPINDLYLDARKLGGILTETLFQGTRALGVVTGVGVNWRRAPRILPPQSVEAISVEDALSETVFSAFETPDALSHMAQALAIAIDVIYQEVFAGEDASILSRWNAFSLTPISKALQQEAFGR